MPPEEFQVFGVRHGFPFRVPYDAEPGQMAGAQNLHAAVFGTESQSFQFRDQGIREEA